MSQKSFRRLATIRESAGALLLVLGSRRQGFDMDYFPLPFTSNHRKNPRLL
jgi:hypothetical protein